MGFAGILMHNLIKINDINKSGATFNLASYWAKEWASILINVIVVCCALVAKHEIIELEFAGNYLAFGFLCIGYMGQSILVKLIGTATKKLNIDDKQG
jgi:hypothetical protein